MALPVYFPLEDYLGAGNLAVYTFDFTIYDPTQLLIVLATDTGVEITRTRGDDATVVSSLVFDPVAGGGTVTFTTVIPNNWRLLLIQANDAPTQPNQFKNKYDLTLARVEGSFDNLGGAIQRLAYRADHCISMSDLDDPTAFNLRFPAGLPGSINLIPMTSNDGTGWAPVNTWISKPDLIAAENAAIAAAASASVSAAQAAASASSAGAAAGGSSDAIAAALAAAASATAASNSANSASTSAGTATTQATTATNAATAAGNSATTASNAATTATTQASNASASASGASTSATNANNSAIAAAASAAQAAASAASTPDVQGSRAAPVSITSGGGVAFNKQNWTNFWFIKGNSGAVSVAVNPQIAAGQVVGQNLELIAQSDTDTISFADGTGLSLNGQWVGEKDRVLGLIWDGSLWVERFRR